MLDQQAARRYSLNFTAMGRNVFNNVNLAPPVGVLESPLFGKSNALAGGFFSSPSSNRSIDLQVSFNFLLHVAPVRARAAVDHDRHF
jgi:hypothetical protein